MGFKIASDISNGASFYWVAGLGPSGLGLNIPRV